MSPSQSQRYNRNAIRIWMLFLIAGPTLIAGIAATGLAQKISGAAAQSISQAQDVMFFETKVRPILKANCLSCHGSKQDAPGGLWLGSRNGVLKGGVSGPAFNAKSPAESLILKAINYQGRQMPPDGKLAQGQIGILTEWVKKGAPWSVRDTAASEQQKKIAPPPVNAETMRFWSFQPVRMPQVPRVKNAAWARNPIDAFILSKLEANGLQPAVKADRTTLIRRATYDLTGLPPTLEEVRAYISDTSPNAWERVVDRLLASPHYGEKWARHWLDLVRYAETNSYERDGVKPNAWRYRDYVVQSLNQDKPYDQFVTEQLAGDELAERSADRLIATGYYRLGIWDDEPSDPEQALYDDLDDIVKTTGEVFLGLTVGCARCHDHKIDPIPQKDYYRLLAFFNGVQRFGVRSFESIYEASLRPIAPDSDVSSHRVEVEAHRAKMRANQTAIDALEARVGGDLIPVEKEDFKDETNRPRIVQRRIGKLISQMEYDHYLELVNERRKLREFQPKSIAMALCVTEEPKPRTTHILLRGNPHVNGDPVEPGFPSVLRPPDPMISRPSGRESSGRRLALARWIASPQNPLTARVMVNRVWQFHFGRGLVRTPSNFGFQGSSPTHPELLDWLASTFSSSQMGLKLKPLHRMILLSSTYQMSSKTNPTALAKDPENDLLWRFDMRRLSAEEIRDSILSVNGSLNLQMGGPSIYVKMPKEVLASQSMPGSGWGDSPPDQQCRRSVYVHVKRSLISPMVASFDGPETDFSCPVRFVTTQPTQALGLLNSDFLNEQAKIFADYLRNAAPGDEASQVRLALQRVTQREPFQKEIARGLALLQQLRNKHGLTQDLALQRFCLVALNLNEFMYLD
jgi:mono/diheme cytochrome c family protein